MQLNSAFGNGPGELPTPVPNQQTMAQAFAPQAPARMPAAASAPAPSPSPSPQPGPAAGMTAQEQQDLQGISPQEMQDLQELSANKNFLYRFGKHLKEHWGEAAGSMVGGVGGGMLTGGLGGEIPGAAAGGAIGEKIQAYVEGKPQPSLGQSAETALMSAAGVATMGGLARIAGGAASGFIKTAGKTAAEDAMAGEAAKVAKQRLSDAQDIGVPALSYQTGDGTVLGAKAMEEGNIVARGDRGVIPQQQLLDIQAQQESGIQGALERIKNLFGMPKTRVPQPGEKMGHLNDELQPHEFAQQWLDRYHGMIDMVKTKAREIFKERQFDATQLMSSVETALKKNDIIDDQGAIRNAENLGSDEHQLLQMWKSLGQASTRKSGLAKGTGGAVPETPPYAATGGAPDSQPVPPPSIQLLPPNAAGPGTAGISFDLLDKIVSKIQKIAATGRQNMNKSYLQPSWDELSKNATTAFHDVIREHLAPADPEAAQLLARVDKLYSGYADAVKDMAGQIRQNPSAAANVFVQKTNPAATRQAFHILTQEQGDVVRRQIIAQEFEKAMVSPGKGTSAQKLIDGLKGYGNENLETIFGNQRGDVMNALESMAQLQRTQISPAARGANLMRLEDAASKSGIIRNALDIFNAMFSNNKDLQHYIGSPDFQARVLRKSMLLNASQKAAAHPATKALEKGAEYMSGKGLSLPGDAIGGAATSQAIEQMSDRQ